MRWQTHVAAGAAAAGIVCNIVDPTAIRACCIIAGSVIGSLLPDIDTSESKISTSSITASCVSVLVEDSIGHRGAVHTPLFMGLLSLAGMLWYLAHISDGWGPAVLLLSIGILLGFATHLLLDMLTPYGIMLLYPVCRKRFVIRSPFAGSVGESHLFSILFLSDIALYAFS